MPAITDTQAVVSEIVIQERVATTEFKIVEIHESIRDRNVRVEVELGPFTTETRPNGDTISRGAGRRGLNIWSNSAYDAVRDTWSNSDLIAAVTAQLNG